MRGKRNTGVMAPTCLTLSGVRPSRLVYVLAYAAHMLLWLVRGHYLGIGVTVWGLPGRLFSIAVYGLSSLVVMLLWRDKFKKLVYGSVAVCVLGFVPFVFLPVGMPRFYVALIAFAGLGGCITAARCGLAFTLNNAERLLSLFLIYFGAVLIREVDPAVTENVFTLYVLPLALLAVMAVCLLRFREPDFEVRTNTDRTDLRALLWATAYFMVYFTVDGYHWNVFGALENAGVNRWFHLAGCVCGGLLFFVLSRYKNGVWHVWNLFFVAAVAMGVLGVLPGTGVLPAALHTVGGLSLIGWPAALYTLASAQRYFADYKYLKLSTVIFVVGAPLLNFSEDVLDALYPEAVPVVTLVVTLVPIVVLLLLSPFSYRDFFSADFVHAMSQADVAVLREQTGEADPFAPYALTPRQREVALLLLSARTRRQIAGELGLSESTVKTHVTELYKRLGISSRVELFRLFPDKLADDPSSENGGSPDGTV